MIGNIREVKFIYSSKYITSGTVVVIGATTWLRLWPSSNDQMPTGHFQGLSGFLWELSVLVNKMQIRKDFCNCFPLCLENYFSRTSRDWNLLIIHISHRYYRWLIAWLCLYAPTHRNTLLFSRRTTYHRLPVILLSFFLPLMGLGMGIHESVQWQWERVLLEKGYLI